MGRYPDGGVIDLIRHPRDIHGSEKLRLYIVVAACLMAVIVWVGIIFLVLIPMHKTKGMAKRILANRLRRMILIIGLVVIGSSLTYSNVLAIDDPTSISIEDVKAYDGVITSGDLLMVVEYNLAYGSTPTETINQAFLGRFLIGQEILGSLVSVEYASVEPYAYNDKGYGRGAFSLYWTKTQKEADSIEFENPNGEIYQINFQGKVGVFPGSAPTTTTETIDWRPSENTQEELFTHVQALANKFQNDAGWTNNTPLISTSSDIIQLTAKGEDYFTNAIPGLGSMVPTLFNSAASSPDDTPSFHSKDFEGKVNTFWDTEGSWVDTRFDNLAEKFRMPKSVITSILSLFIMTGVIWGCARLMDQSDRGWEFGILTIAVTLPILTAVNWMPMGVTMSVALFALLGIGWTLFLRRAGS